MLTGLNTTHTGRVRLEKRREHTVARLFGELSYDDLDAWVPALSVALSTPGARLVLDLSQVEHVDSAAIGNLVALAAEGNTNACRVILADPSPYVAGVLEVTRLDAFFEVCASVGEAEALLAGDF